MLLEILIAHNFLGVNTLLSVLDHSLLRIAQ